MPIKEEVDQTLFHIFLPSDKKSLVRYSDCTDRVKQFTKKKANREALLALLEHIIIQVKED